MATLIRDLGRAWPTTIRPSGLLLSGCAFLLAFTLTDSGDQRGLFAIAIWCGGICLNDWIAETAKTNRAVIFVVTLIFPVLGFVVAFITLVVDHFTPTRAVASHVQQTRAPQIQYTRTKFPCPECNTVIPLEANFCHHCGAVIIEQDKRAYRAIDN